MPEAPVIWLHWDSFCPNCGDMERSWYCEGGYLHRHGCHWMITCDSCGTRYQSDMEGRKEK